MYVTLCNLKLLLPPTTNQPIYIIPPPPSTNPVYNSPASLPPPYLIPCLKDASSTYQFALEFFNVDPPFSSSSVSGGCDLVGISCQRSF